MVNPDSMSEAEYASLIAAAHNQLHAPVILIWDSLNTHVSAVMHDFTGRASQLPGIQQRDT